MSLSSFEDKEVLNQLKANGYYFLNTNRYSDLDIIGEYQFIINEMNQRNLNNKYNAVLPIWGYLSDNYNIDELVDEEVLLEFDVPDELVVKSNHTYFENYILLNYPIAVNKNQDELYYDGDNSPAWKLGLQYGCEVLIIIN